MRACLAVLLFSATVASARMPETVSFYGQADAPVKLLAFMSPGCQDSIQAFKQTIVPQLERDYLSTGKVRMTVVITPLDRNELEFATVLACSPAGVRLTLDWQLRNGFPKDAKWAMSNAPAGFHLQPVDQCADRDVIERVLLQSREVATRVFGATGTPSFVVGGKLLFNPAYRILTDALDQELKSPTPARVAFSTAAVSAPPGRDFLGSDAVRSLLAGKHIVWRNDRGRVIENDFGSDGSLSSKPLGSSERARRAGIWTVNASGQLCLQRVNDEQNCLFLFHEGGVTKAAHSRHGVSRFQLIE